MEHIVIHGVTSFLGKHLINKLIEDKKPVIVIARESSDIGQYENLSSVELLKYKSSIEEIPESKKILPANTVFYEFSWFGVFGEYRNFPEQLTINIPLIISSLKFAKVINARHWIGIGSQAEYGNLNKKISEDDTCNPTTLYGKSKLICSQISKDLCKEYGIEHTWLRLFSVFGPGDSNNWLIPYLIKDMFNDKPINATKGEQCWDYLYVDDVIDVLYRLLDSKGLGIVNLGSGKSIQIKFLIEKIKEIIDSNSVLNLGAIEYRNDQVMLMEADIKKLSTLLNWKPKVDLETGLNMTIKYFREKVN